MTRPLAAAVLVAAAFAVLAAVLMPADPPQRPAVAVAEAAVATDHTQPADAFLRQLVGPGTDLSDAQITDLTTAADLVCEGTTAGVPEGFMIRSTADTLGLTLQEAHRLVETALTTRCAR